MSVHLPNILYDIPRNIYTAVGVPVALGLLSGSRTRNVVDSNWYKSLAVPPGRPPRQAFPIVWTTLYVCMGYASHLAVTALDTSVVPLTRSDLILGLKLYYVQLGLNVLWTPLFFGAKQTGAALIDSTLLAGTTMYMTKLLHGPTGGKSTYFLAPYCVWLTYATYLNGGIWLYNRGRKDRSV